MGLRLRQPEGSRGLEGGAGAHRALDPEPADGRIQRVPNLRRRRRPPPPPGPRGAAAIARVG